MGRDELHLLPFRSNTLEQMKKKVDRHSSPEFDKFDRKQKKHTASHKAKSSKHKLSIYDEFDDEDLMGFSSDVDDWQK